VPLTLDLNPILDPALRRQLERIRAYVNTIDASGGSAAVSPSNTTQSASEPFIGGPPTRAAVDMQLLDKSYLYWAALPADTVLAALARIRWSAAAAQMQFDVGTTTRAVLTSLGLFGVGTAAPGAMVHALANADAVSPVVAQGHSAGQAADLLACLRSDSTKIASINSSGQITAGGSAPVAAGALFSADGFTTPGSGASYYMKNTSGHLWRMQLDDTVSRLTIAPDGLSTWLLRLGTAGSDSESVLAQSQGTGIVALGVRGYAGQTANLQEWQTSSINVLASMSASGGIAVTGFTMATGAGASKVLTSDASGVGTWATAAASSGTGDAMATSLLLMGG